MSISTLRVMTYNIHVGIRVRSFPDWARNSWKHLAPSPCKRTTLDVIADVIRSYDLVALQEIDLGSQRSSNIHQGEYLAKAAGFPYMVARRNRNLGALAQHGMCLLSRYPLRSRESYQLPGSLPGRGVLLAEVDVDGQGLCFATTHLSLSKKDRLKQLRYLDLILANKKRLVLTGDFNCSPQEIEAALWHGDLKLWGGASPDSYPSWRPARPIDHILCAGDVRLQSLSVVPFPCSDHFPVIGEVQMDQE